MSDKSVRFRIQVTSVDLSRCLNWTKEIHSEFLGDDRSFKPVDFEETHLFLYLLSTSIERDRIVNGVLSLTKKHLKEKFSVDEDKTLIDKLTSILTNNLDNIIHVSVDRLDYGFSFNIKFNKNLDIPREYPYQNVIHPVANADGTLLILELNKYNPESVSIIANGEDKTCYNMYLLVNVKDKATAAKLLIGSRVPLQPAYTVHVLSKDIKDKGLIGFKILTEKYHKPRKFIEFLNTILTDNDITGYLFSVDEHNVARQLECHKLFSGKIDGNPELIIDGYTYHLNDWLTLYSTVLDIGEDFETHPDYRLEWRKTIESYKYIVRTLSNVAHVPELFKTGTKERTLIVRQNIVTKLTV